MNQNYNTVVDAALQLSPEQRKRLIERLSEINVSNGEKNGDVTKYFGTFHSDNPRSGDNDKIDEDLALAYLDTHETEN